MKKMLLVIFIAGFSNFLPAQNWSLLNKNYKYNYSLGNTGYITNTLYADSFQVSGNDTMFFMNRIITECDTCSTSNLFLKNQPQFMQRKVMFSNGVYCFIDTSYYAIKPHSNVGGNWIFDTINNNSATVVSVFQSSIFGQSDSIKQIILGSGDSIIISKRFGIIQFPDFKSNQSYTLIGIEGLNIGEIEPKFKEIFDFNVGDVFQYDIRKTIAVSAPTQIRHEKITILDKQYYTDSIKYEVNVFVKKYKYYVIIYEEQYFHFDSILIFRDSSNHICNKYNHEIIKPVYHEQIGFTPDSLVYGRMENSAWIYITNGFLQSLKTKGIDFHGPFQLYNFSSSSIISYDLLEPAWVATYMNLFAIGLGQCIWHCDPFEYPRSNYLIGYVKNGDTTGTVYPDEYFLEINEQGLSVPGISVFPNPMAEKAGIKLHNSNQLLKFRSSKSTVIV